MTKLMDQAIAYLRQLPANEQDAIARDILRSSEPVEDEAERQHTVALLAEADDDVANGRVFQDSDEFWESLKDRISKRKPLGIAEDQSKEL